MTSLAQYMNRAVKCSVLQSDSQDSSQVFYTFIFGIAYNHALPVFWLGKAKLFIKYICSENNIKLAVIF